MPYSYRYFAVAIRIRMVTVFVSICVDYMVVCSARALQEFVQSLSLASRESGRKLVNAHFSQAFHAAEPFQEFSRGLLPNARNGRQRSAHAASASAQPMESHRKSVSLVANLLNHMQYGRAVLQSDRIVLSPVNVQNLFALGDAR